MQSRLYLLIMFVCEKHGPNPRSIYIFNYIIVIV